VKSGNLDRRKNTANDQRGRDQITLHIRSEIGGSGKNDGWSNDACQHSQCVLETEQESKKNGHAIMQSEERRSASLPLHEWEIGSEKERIVIGSNEALPKAG